MEADESELADVWDEGDYSNTKFKALSAPGTKLIQRETSQEWFSVGWQEFHDQDVAIEDKPSARYGTGPGSRSCEMLCKLKIFEDAKLRDQMASAFAREAWIVVGDVAAVRAAFEDSQLIPDWLEQCRAYDEEASDTCKSLADLPRPREWVLAITNRNRSTTKRAGIARHLAFRCDEGGLRHSSTVNNAQWSMLAAGYITRHVWYSMHLQGNIVTSHLNGFNTDANPKSVTIEPKHVNLARLRRHNDPYTGDCPHGPECHLEGRKISRAAHTKNIWMECENEFRRRAEWFDNSVENVRK